MANAISDNASKIAVVSDVLLNHIVTLADATHLAAILEEGDKPKRIIGEQMDISELERSFRDICQ